MNLVARPGRLVVRRGRPGLPRRASTTSATSATPTPAWSRPPTAQLRRLNTNSRFVYPGIAQYAERLAALLPDPLEVVFLVCSGSEANDLAMRMARAGHRPRRTSLVIDGAYHGNTAVVTGLSPNRYKGPGGTGADPTTHEVEQPDRYRGQFGVRRRRRRRQVRRRRPAAGRSADVADGRPPAAFIAESAMGTAGSIVFPDGYLERRVRRRAGRRRPVHRRRGPGRRSAGSATCSGDSRARAWFRTSSPWASRSATAIRWPRW